jgi:hypothetical protein
MRRVATIVAALLFATAACARNDTGYSGGVYTDFPTPNPLPLGSPLPPTTPAPWPTSTPHGPDSTPRPLSAREADILVRERRADLALRQDEHSGSAVGTFLYTMLDAEWRSGRIAPLRRDLATIGDRFSGSSNAAEDQAYLGGDRFAAFEKYARFAPDRSPQTFDTHPDLMAAYRTARAARWRDTILHLRRVHDDERPFGLEITAALLEGDSYAACGRYAAARTTWFRAWNTSVMQLPDTYRFRPEWTSAMRRLVHFRTTPDRPSHTPTCAGLPKARNSA